MQTSEGNGDAASFSSGSLLTPPVLLDQPHLCLMIGGQRVAFLERRFCIAVPFEDLEDSSTRVMVSRSGRFDRYPRANWMPHSTWIFGYAISSAWICNIVLFYFTEQALGHPIGTALVVCQVAYGFGKPAYYMTPHQYQEFSKVTTFATLMFTKVSICLFLLRITVTPSTIRPLQAAFVMLVVSNIVLSLAWIFQCTPHLDKAWNDKLPGKCFTKVISIISDFFLSLFPIIILRKVQIGFRDKVGLCLLMGLGVITGSLSIVRTVLNGQNVAHDTSWDSLPNWYWRAWEVFFGIVAACIPTLRPGYKWLRARIRGRFLRIDTNDAKPAAVESTAKKWTPPKPSALLRSLGRQTMTDSSAGQTGSSTKYTRDDDFLPLQNFDPSTRADLEHYPHDGFGNERRDPLHIPGDLSTHRPGHLKRLDSEAKVGGGLGAEEVEERI
ncbi:MAG: hypothetical protein Q9170_003364 [Blastenia crenularia]